MKTDIKSNANLKNLFRISKIKLKLTQTLSVWVKTYTNI